jgi:hypothetical protein
MAVAQIMSGPRSKIQRANRHIDELRDRTNPLDRSLYEITSRKERETVLHVQPNVFQVTYRPKENIPEVLGAIIGDALGNLRAALDHLTSGLVREWGQTFQGSLYYPMAPRKDLISHTGLAAIEQALPGAKSLILDEIRPDGGPNEHLWDFYTLNKDDKHNFLIPTVNVVLVEIQATIAANGTVFEDCQWEFNAARPSVLIKSPFPITIQNNFETTVQVKFGQGTPFQDEAVVPTLTQISEVVSEALNAFERLAIATKGRP